MNRDQMIAHLVLHGWQPIISARSSGDKRLLNLSLSKNLIDYHEKGICLFRWADGTLASAEEVYRANWLDTEWARFDDHWLDRACQRLARGLHHDES